MLTKTFCSSPKIEIQFSTWVWPIRLFNMARHTWGWMLLSPGWCHHRVNLTREMFHFVSCLPFADCAAYLTPVGASLAQILPQINLYPSSPRLCRSPIIFPFFSYCSPPSWWNAVSGGFFSAKRGNTRWFGEIMSQSGGPAQLRVALGFASYLCMWYIVLHYVYSIYHPDTWRI